MNFLSTSACQRVSVAAGKIAAHEADTRTEAYVDDTGGVAMGTVADEHYRNILRVMEELGLQVAPDKCSLPAYWMIWIGVLFNARNMTMAIDPERIREATEACRAFLEASTISLHGLQCFLGKLFHAIKCTESARAFIARILDLLRLAIREGTVAKMDAAWCAAFLDRFNGITIAKPDVAEIVASVDSCLTGGGGFCEGHGYYAVEYPDCITCWKFSISSLECFNVLLALRLWAPSWSGKYVLLFCDNAAKVGAANSCHAEDPLIRSVLREIWWLTAIWDVQLTVRHMPGSQMTTADMLSRVRLKQRSSSLKRRLAKRGLRHPRVCSHHLCISDSRYH